MVFFDIFRSNDLKGWAKALWVLFVLILPLIGILAYLIVRGDKMQSHVIEAARQQEQAFRRYVQSVARRPPTSWPSSPTSRSAGSSPKRSSS